MKVEIYNESPKHPEEPVLRLALRPSDTHTGGVEVVAVNEAGETLSRGHLLCFMPDGHVTTYRSVDPNIGLNLDGSRRLIVEDSF